MFRAVLPSLHFSPPLPTPDSLPSPWATIAIQCVKSTSVFFFYAPHPAFLFHFHASPFFLMVLLCVLRCLYFPHSPPVRGGGVAPWCAPSPKQCTPIGCDGDGDLLHGGLPPVVGSDRPLSFSTSPFSSSFVHRTRDDRNMFTHGGRRGGFRDGPGGACHMMITLFYFTAHSYEARQWGAPADSNRPDPRPRPFSPSAAFLFLVSRAVDGSAGWPQCRCRCVAVC